LRQKQRRGDGATEPLHPRPSTAPDERAHINVRHGFEAGLAEYKRLEQVFPALGYKVIRLPKVTVPERTDFVFAALAD
jgi:predicted ATPase